MNRMKKHFSKFFALLLAMLLVVGALPTTAFAGDEGFLQINISIDNSPANGHYYQEGETIQYSIAVKNPTDSTIDNIEIKCSIQGTEAILSSSETIAENSTYTQSDSYVVTAADVATKMVSIEAKTKYGASYNSGIMAVSTVETDPSGITIDETNFPDENFRKYVRTNLDNDANGRLSDSEVAATTSLYVRYEGIASLKGIEYFSALTKLYCNYNQLTSLDVSSNTALTELDCSHNQLTSLDVSSNTALTELDCSHNQLTSLDVSSNTALAGLYCSYNQLTNLDVSTNAALAYLTCGDNLLTSLDVNLNTALEYLSCDNNQLTSLDVSNNTALAYWNAKDNEYKITVSIDRTFDLATLPGTLDVSKASEWNGGSVIGNTLTANEDAAEVTYTYDCGNSKSETFKLLVKVKEPEVMVIDTIDVKDLVEPVYGASSDFTFTIPSDKGYTTYDDGGSISCSWSETVEAPGTMADVGVWDAKARTNIAHSSTGTFLTYRDGYYYTFAVQLQLQEGYRWADTVNVTVNGKTGIGQFLKSTGPLADTVICMYDPLEKPAEPTTVSYILVEGDGQTVTKGNTAKFVSDAPFEKFDKVQVDGVDVATSEFTAVPGSTDVTFNADYIKSLSEGEHTIAIVSNDGEATGKFTVKAASSDDIDSGNSGESGDNSGDSGNSGNIGNDSGNADSNNENNNDSGNTNNTNNTGDTTTDNNSKHVVPNTAVNTVSPKTGDTSNIALWIALMVSSIAGIGFLVFGKRRKFFTK